MSHIMIAFKTGTRRSLGMIVGDDATNAAA